MTDEDSVERQTREWIAAVPEIDIGEYPVSARVMHAARLYEAAMERIAARRGISYRDIYLLMALRRAGRPLTPTELIDEMSITMAAVTKRVDRLEETGFVRRSRSENDGRSVRIELTDAGRSLVDDARANRQPEMHVVNGEFTPEERELLTTLLRRLLVRLEQVAGETG